MADKRRIFNLALAEYGDSSVTNPDTDNTVHAGRLRDVYPQIYDNVLESHPWNDCITRANLAKSATKAPLFGYGNLFPLKENPYTLRVLMVGDSPSGWFAKWGSFPGRGPLVAPAVPTWAVEGRAIVTDLGGPLPVMYIARVDEGALRESLANVISLALAAATCFKATQNRGLTVDIRERAKEALAAARSIDAQEGGQINPWQSDFLEAR